MVAAGFAGVQRQVLAGRGDTGWDATRVGPVYGGQATQPTGSHVSDRGRHLRSLEHNRIVLRWTDWHEDAAPTSSE